MSKNILHDKALLYLSQREHSRHELDQKLAKCSEHAEMRQEVLDALVQQNLLSDERFTEQYIRMRARRGFGPQRIEQELRQRGVSCDLIEQSLQHADIDWDENTYAIWEKKFKTMPDDYKQRSKQMHFLQYRGFTTEQIRTVFEDK